MNSDRFHQPWGNDTKHDKAKLEGDTPVDDSLYKYWYLFIDNLEKIGTKS